MHMMRLASGRDMTGAGGLPTGVAAAVGAGAEAGAGGGGGGGEAADSTVTNPLSAEPALAVLPDDDGGA